MKMKRNSNESFRDIISILKDLNKTYPNQGVARHMHDATLEYKNLWGLEDKELLIALTKYKAELDLNIVSEDEVEAILKDAMSIDKNLEDYFREDQEWDNEG